MASFCHTEQKIVSSPRQVAKRHSWHHLEG